MPHDTQRLAAAAGHGGAQPGRARDANRRAPACWQGKPQPEVVAQLAASLPADRWVAHTIKEGSKGPLVARFAAMRVIAVREGLPGPEVWLVLRRNVLTGRAEDLPE